MVTDVSPMLAEESSVANPQKVAKIDENIKKLGWQHCFCRGITRFLGIISEISSHLCHQLTIGYHRWHRVIPDIMLVTGSKISIGYPRTSATDKKINNIIMK
jgi:hypothetical protein